MRCSLLISKCKTLGVTAEVQDGARNQTNGLKWRHESVCPCVSPGAEPDVPPGDPAAGELSVHQQAGEGADGADQSDQQAARQERVRTHARLRGGGGGRRFANEF